jgi:hypothetical protein
MMWLVVWVCLRADPSQCEIWNIPYEGITMMGCQKWGKVWMAAWEDPTWVAHRYRCSLTPAEEL